MTSPTLPQSAPSDIAPHDDRTSAYLPPVILCGYSSQPLARHIADALRAPLAEVKHAQFRDSEIRVEISGNVRGHDVVVVASAAGDVNKEEKEANLLMGAARRAGARSITLFLPYMYYGRADGMFSRRAYPALIDTIETLRGKCSDVIVADPHNADLVREKFLDSGSNVRTCEIVHFAFPHAVQLQSLIDQKMIHKDSILFTHADAGSVKRISVEFRASLYEVLGYRDRKAEQDDWAQGFKDRDKATEKSRTKGISLRVRGKDVVIFEDMIDSGGTACELATLLKQKGARSVLLFATSGLFMADLVKGEVLTGPVDRLNTSAIDAVFITDTYDHKLTTPALAEAIATSPVIHVLDTAPYLAAIIGAVHAPPQQSLDARGNSIRPLLRGTHPRQTMPGQTLSRPVPLKPGNALMNRHLVHAPRHRPATPDMT